MQGIIMKKPNIKLGKIEHVQEGKAYYWKERSDGTYVEMSLCCDCDLAHIIEMKPIKGAMRVKVWRDDKITEELRKKNNTGPKT